MSHENDYYLGNRNLPTDTTTFSWTPEMIRELKKCKKSILQFANHFYIISLDEGKIPIKLYKFQKRVLKALNKHRFNIVLSPRQSGKTTLMTIYALWIVCFEEDQRILFMANKEQTAINIFKRVRLAYEMLPNYLKPGVISYGRTGMELANGSSIGISTTSSDAARGESVNCVDGSSIITVRDKETQETFKISMKELADGLENEKNIIPINLINGDE